MLRGMMILLSKFCIYLAILTFICFFPYLFYCTMEQFLVQFLYSKTFLGSSFCRAVPPTCAFYACFYP
ncbi:hypothetical protein AMECASPLE_037834, partial [Ameca splendens]